MLTAAGVSPPVTAQAPAAYIPSPNAMGAMQSFMGSAGDNQRVDTAHS